MDYQYKSICRGEHSIYGQIEKEGVDPRSKLFSSWNVSVCLTSTPRAHFRICTTGLRPHQQDARARGTREGSRRDIPGHPAWYCRIHHE
jgi:hypothetical protein